MNKKELAGQAAASLVRDGMILGLGTGSTAYYAINAIGAYIKDGMNVKAVATSSATIIQAEKLGIPLLSIDEVDTVDLAIDGVDEIDSVFNAIKGGGGALFREKVIASMANQVIWIMDDSKLVKELGAFPLPVEVARFGHRQVLNQLSSHGYCPELRRRNGTFFVTDNGNYILDLHLNKGFAIEEVITTLESTIGVLEHGLFLNMCDKMIVGTEDGVRFVTNSFKHRS